jgi:type VI secretion system secreted protein Hcp
MHLKKVSILASSTIAVLLLGWAGMSYFQMPSQSIAPAQTSATKTPDQLLADVFSLQNAEAFTGDYFLKIPGINGESTIQGHTGEMNILSFSWGAQNTPFFREGGLSAGIGRVQMSGITFTKYLDSASPQLFLAVASGKHYSNATFTIVRYNGDSLPSAYYTIKMDNVMVTSFQQNGTSGDRPTETFNLSFSKIEITYQPQRPDGSLGEGATASWDLATNRLQ